MYKIVRCTADGSTELETIGIMAHEDFVEYTLANFVNKDHTQYKAVFRTKTEAKSVLALLKENGADTWLLGVNPETEQGEILVITTEEIDPE